MINQLISVIFILLAVLGVAIAFYLVWWMFWNIILLPIRKKDDIINERDDAKQELIQIQAQKGVEWDRYKELQDEYDKTRKAYFSLKEDQDKLKEDVAKLKTDKDNLVAYNKELKKQSKPS